MNMHKPNIQKERRYNCTSNETVTPTHQQQTDEQGEKKSFRKKVLRLLGSVISKKKHPDPSVECETENQEPLPVKGLVSSSDYTEKDHNPHGQMTSQNELKILFEQKVNTPDNDILDSILLPETKSSYHVVDTGPYQFDTAHSLPSTSGLVGTTGNTALHICEGDSELDTISNHLETQELEVSNVHREFWPRNISPHYKLEKKKPLHHMTSHPPNMMKIEIHEQSSFEGIYTDNGFGMVPNECENQSKDIIHSTLSKTFKETASIEDSTKHGMTLIDDIENKYDDTQTLSNQELQATLSFNVEQNNCNLPFSTNDVNYQTPQKLLQQILELEIKKYTIDIINNVLLNKKFNSPRNEIKIGNHRKNSSNKVVEDVSNVIEIVDFVIDNSLPEASHSNNQHMPYSTDEINNEHNNEELGQKYNLEENPSPRFNYYTDSFTKYVDKFQSPNQNIDEITKKNCQSYSSKSMNIDSCLQVCEIINESENAEDLCKTCSDNQNMLISTDPELGNNASQSYIQETNSQACCGRVKMQNNLSESKSSEKNSNLIFSSPIYQINLTNPFIKK